MSFQGEDPSTPRNELENQCKYLNRRNRKVSAVACCRHFLPRSSPSLLCFLLIPSCSDRRRLLIICHVLTHCPETKQTLIIKHNYSRSLTRDRDGDNRKEKTKYDNCVREKSNCAKQSYTHLINLARAGSHPRKLTLSQCSLYQEMSSRR